VITYLQEYIEQGYLVCLILTQPRGGFVDGRDWSQVLKKHKLRK